MPPTSFRDRLSTVLLGACAVFATACSPLQEEVSTLSSQSDPLVETQTLSPTEDAWVLSTTPTDNYGLDTELRTKQLSAGGGRRAFLKFDLSGIQGTVQGAKLRVYNVFSSAGATLAVVGTDDAWTESTLHWNNQPVLEAPLGTGSPVANTWLELDVTGFVAGELAGDKVVTLALTEQTTGHDNNFASRENTNAAVRPVLELAVSPSTCGNGLVEAGEQCDQGACCNEDCTLNTVGGLCSFSYPPQADSWVKSTEASVNYGTDTELRVKQLSSSEGRRAFLAFDLPDVTGTVKSAKLRLFTVYQQPGTTLAAVAVGNDTWTESGLTWTNQPAPGSTLGSGTPVLNQWLELDVTSFVSTQLAGDRRVTLAVVEKSTQHDTNLASREHPTLAYRPHLKLEVDSGPALPTVSIAHAAAKLEGHSGTTAFTFTVTRAGDTSAESALAWEVSGAGPELTGSDFVGGVLPSGTLSFAAGETSKTLTVEVQGDLAAELDEAFTVTLQNPSGCIIEEGSASSTILNDDTGAVLGIAAPSPSAKVEGQSGTTPFTFTVTRTGSTSGTCSAGWSVSSAAPELQGADFVGGVLPSGTVSFAAGETTKTLTVNVQGETTPEADEAFTVTLGNASGCVPGTSAATATILNDDASTSVSISAVSAAKSEGHSGATAFTFSVTRTGVTTGTSSVAWRVAGEVDAADFVGGVLTGTVSFAAGETAKTLTLNVQGDTAVESDEDFSVVLSNPTGCGIGTGVASGTLKNDDSNGSVFPAWFTTAFPSVPALASVPAGNKKPIVTSGDLARLTSSTLLPGTNFVISPSTTGRSISSSSTFTVTGKGTAEAPIVIRGDTDSADPKDYPELANLTLNITGTHVILYKLRLRNVQVKIGGSAQNTQILRNWFYGNDSKTVIDPDGDGWKYLRVAYNLFRANGTSLLKATVLDISGYSAANPSRFLLFEYNHVAGLRRGATAQYESKVLFLGHTTQDTAIDTQSWIRYNLSQDNQNGEGQSAVETKCSGVYMYYNTLDVRSGEAQFLRVRHGRLTRESNKEVGVGIGMELVGNLCVHPTTSSPTCGVQVRDGYHFVLNNWSVKLDSDTQQPTASTPIGNGQVQLHAGNLAWENYPANETNQPKGSRWVQAAKVAAGGNRMVIKVGYETAASTTLPAKYCRVAPASTSRPDRNYQVDLVNDKVNGVSTTDMTTSVNAKKPRVGLPDADYSLPPRRMLPAEVGPGAP